MERIPATPTMRPFGCDARCPRQTEVRDTDAPVIADEDVVRLEVPVNDLGRVRGCEATACQKELVEYLSPAPWARSEPLAERAALHVLHREEDHLADLPHVIDRDDIRVIEACHRTGFASQPLVQRLSVDG